ncbi:MAG: BrnT family toxin [Lentisphaerae bacterium]|nr:BrnT family toxin [Lentisphaerota bacterium]
METTRFEWDEDKDRLNQEKHGISFHRAQYAFADPRRVIAQDVSHGAQEKRLYCIGKAGGEILTVRFTYRNQIIRIFGAGYWRKGKKLYEEQKLRVIRDFLPSPDELAFKEEKVKVTISLSRASLDFFKHEADRHHTAYQKMIRNLLDAYAVRHK